MGYVYICAVGTYVLCAWCIACGWHVTVYRVQQACCERMSRQRWLAATQALCFRSPFPAALSMSGGEAGV